MPLDADVAEFFESNPQPTLETFQWMQALRLPERLDQMEALFSSEYKRPFYDLLAALSRATVRPSTDEEHRICAYFRARIEQSIEEHKQADRDVMAKHDAAMEEEGQDRKHYTTQDRKNYAD